MANTSDADLGAADRATGAVVWEDRVWRHDGLQARIHRPVGSGDDGPGPVVIDVHGGAWATRDRTLGHAYDVAVAAAGHPVVAVDFRDGRQARHPAAVDDIAEAVGWVLDGGADLAVDPARVALIGSSSGGHLALHTALTALDDRLPDGLALVGAFWPPVDPLARYRYARTMVGRPVPEGNRLDAIGLLASTEAYFGDEATMAAASITTVLDSGRTSVSSSDRASDRDGGRLPPLWLVEAGRDLNVPVAMLDELESAWRDAGGEVERTVYPDEIHGFGHGDHDGAARFRHDLVARLDRALG